MRSSTSVLKKGKIPQFTSWELTDFTKESPVEDQEILMYAEGVIEPQVWITPEERGEQDKIHIQDELLNIDDQRREIVSVLINKKKGSHTSPVFKEKEIKVSPFSLPEIELLQEESRKKEEQPQEELIDESIQLEKWIEEAKQQAQQIIEEAKQEANTFAAKVRQQSQAEAEQLIERAKANAAEIIQQARQSETAITQEAQRKGLEAARGEARQFLQTAQSLIAGLEKAHGLMLERSEEEVIQLVKTILQNLFAHGAALPESVLKEAFQKAIEEAKPLGNIRIRANPEDIAVLGDLWLAEQQRLHNVTVEWLPSEDILRGGCIIEGDFGSLDARLDAKLERVLDKIDEIQQLPPDTRKEDEGEDSSVLREDFYYSKEDNKSKQDVEILAGEADIGVEESLQELNLGGEGDLEDASLNRGIT